MLWSQIWCSVQSQWNNYSGDLLAEIPYWRPGSCGLNCNTARKATSGKDATRNNQLWRPGVVTIRSHFLVTRSGHRSNHLHRDLMHRDLLLVLDSETDAGWSAVFRHNRELSHKMACSFTSTNDHVPELRRTSVNLQRACRSLDVTGHLPKQDEVFREVKVGSWLTNKRLEAKRGYLSASAVRTQTFFSVFFSSGTAVRTGFINFL